MWDNEIAVDRYEDYEELFAPLWIDQKAQRRPKANHKPKKPRDEILAALTDDSADVELGFNPTYRPSRYEAGWLLSSLHSFYDEGLITDVLSLIKGGKEASVYRCQAHRATGQHLLAAKVYRPRMFRSLRNDKIYRQGREILVSGGRPAGRDSGYIERAIRNKTPFGQQAAHTSWLMHEFTAIERLHAVGAAVPQPIAASENAILMSYHGDDRMGAPTLNSITLERDEAEQLFREVLRNIDLMLQHDMIHGDLSAYNILYWAADDSPAQITLIDFPQVVNLQTNDKAYMILQRDIRRICEHFAQQGVPYDAGSIMAQLWSRHTKTIEPDDLAADWSRRLVDMDGLPAGLAADAIPADKPPRF